MMEARALLRVIGASKRFGDARALDDVSLDIAPGEFFALLGPSGCGKTTLMRAVAGLERLDAGRIEIGGEDATDAPAHRRPVNMMFQSYALFPHMNVAQNIGFGLARAGLSRGEIEPRIRELLRLVQMEGFGGRKPDQLSGGQRQRVALARALARRPQLLLLDEPLAALDRKLREATQFELRTLQRTIGASFVMVTHDQDEAMIMADRIGVMREGRLEQIGSPREIYDAPVNRWVAGFIGDVNFFDVTLEKIESGQVGLRGTDGSPFQIPDNGEISKFDLATLVCRPEHVRIAAAEIDGSFGRGEVIDAAFRGDRTLWRIRAASGAIVLSSQPSQGDGQKAFRPGDQVWMAVKHARLLTT